MDGKGILRKDFFSKRLITGQIVSFLLVIAIIWLDELVDVPYLLLGAEMTPINWREALLETLLIIPLAIAVTHHTMILLGKMKYLEGFLPICSSCKRIRDEQGNWQQLEMYINARSEAKFTHGICPQCAQQLYPEVFPKTAP